MRRRRSRLSRHSDSGSDSKHDATASSSAAAPVTRATSSVGIQTISDCSQTEPDQLPRSPHPHHGRHRPQGGDRQEDVGTREDWAGAEPGLPDGAGGKPRAWPGRSSWPTAISPYLAWHPDRHPRAPWADSKKKPDPLEIGYQAHSAPRVLSQLVSRQPPKSPQVLLLTSLPSVPTPAPGHLLCFQ